MKRLPTMLFTLILSLPLIFTPFSINKPAETYDVQAAAERAGIPAVSTLDNNRLIFLPMVRKPYPLPGPFNKSYPSNQQKYLITILDLQWSSSIGAINYEYCVDELNDNICNTSWQPSDLNYNWVTNLKDSTWHYWQVRALNADGAST